MVLVIDGISLSNDMLCIFRWHKVFINCFQIKYGIPKCRPMMGCMDETNTLEYTEIFEHCLYWPNINLMPESGLKRDRF